AGAQPRSVVRGGGGDRVAEVALEDGRPAHEQLAGARPVLDPTVDEQREVDVRIGAADGAGIGLVAADGDVGGGFGQAVALLHVHAPLRQLLGRTRIEHAAADDGGAD